MPVDSAGRLEASSSMWWAVALERTAVQPNGLLWVWDDPGLCWLSFLYTIHVICLHARPSLTSLPLPKYLNPWLGRTGGGWISWEMWLPYSSLIEVRNRLQSLYHWMLQRESREVTALDKAHREEMTKVQIGEYSMYFQDIEDSV